MRRTNLPGHALRSEGAAYVPAENDLRGRVDTTAGGREFTRCRGHVGCGLCECGAQSPMLHSNAARQRWHRDVHKAAIRKAVAVADPDPFAITFEVTITMTAEQRALYGAGLGVGFVAQDVLGRVRPEVLDAVKAISWVGQYASVSISRPEAVPIAEGDSSA